MTPRSSSRFAQRPLPQLFEGQAARTPERIAVVCDGQALSYRELNERANRLAHRLRGMGIGPEMLVALYLERSLDLVVSILGVLKAGGGYLPLDLESPGERLAFLLRDAAPAAVIAHATLRDRLPPDRPAVLVADADTVGIGDEPSANPEPAAQARNLAYVIYTSGSTGAPKGVLIEHQSVANLLDASEQLFSFGPDDVWTLFHSAAFDFSVWELWGALLYGGRLVVVPRQVARSAEDFHALCVRERVTVLNQTPSAFRAFIDADRARVADSPPLSLRYVIFGGEALAVPALRPWIAAHGDERPQLVNMYGITETTVHVTARRITQVDLEPGNESRSVIGVPIPGYCIRLMEPGALGLVADGYAGEMVVGGAGLARGYLNRPDLTAERFVRSSSDAAGERLYRSGDLARRLPDGGLEYLGRIDQQVKIRGFRVELGEIEAALSGHEGVAQAAVALRHESSDDKRLVAYWARRPGARATSRDLRAHATAKLPAYMVPSSFVELGQLPLTVNGKLDRPALAGVTPVRADDDLSVEAPRDAIEARLAAIWADVLGVERIGVHDGFFDHGGHSLLAAQVVARVRAQLGVRVPISLIFEQPTIARFAAAVRLLQSASTESPESVPPPLAQHDQRRSPMSFAQRGLWFVEQLKGQSRAYLLPEAWRMHGPLDVAALEHSLAAIVRRHASLRTRFELEDGEPIQIVEDACAIDVMRHDLRGLPDAAQDAEVRRLAAEEADCAFDLRQSPLLRARLLVLGDHDHVLLVTVHHIASDAWSREIFVRELERLYFSYRRGESPSLVPLPIDYASFARRQRASLTPARERQLLTYWRRQLAGPARLELPTDGPRPLSGSDRGREAGFEIPQPLLDRLRRLASDGHVTMQMLLAAAYHVLLGRYCGEEDVAIATFAAGRDSTDVESLIGVFVNQIVLRSDLSGRPTFRECLARVRTVSLDAYDHQDLPFERLVADLHPDRRRGENPIARVSFQFLTLDDAAPALDGLRVARLPAEDSRARFDLELTVRVAPEGLRGAIVYRTDLFSHARIEQLAASYLTILESAAASPDSTIDTLTPLAASERDRQLLDWSGVSRAPAARPCVHERFAGQAAQTPDAPAVTFGAASLTYGQLNADADRLARRLRDLGAGPGQVIALHVERSTDLVVSMLAVLKAGAAYMPLDPTYPAERLAFMMRDQQAAVLIADRHVPASLAGLAKHCLVVPDGHSSASPAPASPDAADVRPDDLAYVMYTSGSTGQPKGVGVPHRAITRLVLDSDYIQIDASDRMAQASNAAFDAATFEIWGALLNGAHVVGIDRTELLSPEQLSKAVRERGITVLFLTTALFHEVAATAPGLCASLRALLFGGEALNPDAVRAVLAAGGPSRLLHVYGPTENTTFSTWFEVSTLSAEADSVPIGRPIAGSTCYVLDSRQSLLPAGAAGELYVGGAGLAAGYRCRPELTAERFVPHPFAAGERLYRTGDRVRWCAGGVLQFLGRIDRQVKLRGHRIELEEIESTSSRHAAVAACTVVLREDRPGDKRLVAYWVGRPGASVAGSDLRDHLRRQLPDYMVPAAFIELPALPLTANGKVDRASLPPPDPAQLGHLAGLARTPATPLEEILMGIFRELLELPHVDRDATFFDLGGTSLKVFPLIDRIKRRCGRDVSAADVFMHPSVASLASLLDDDAQASRPSSTIAVIRQSGKRPPIYFPPGILGEVLVDEAILEALPHDQPVYALSHPFAAEAAPSLESLAAQFCDRICAFQPHGPISLAGHSFAGLLAYEMARQLRRRGREMAMVAIFDTGPDRSAARSAAEAIEGFVRFLDNLPRWIGEDLVRSFDRRTPARLGRSLRKLLRSIAGHSQSRVDDLFDTSGWPRELYAHVENNLRLLDTFTYRPYAGAVVVFRARVRPLLTDHTRDLGWSAVASHVRVVDVPGNHETMLLAPHVRVVARALRAALDA